MIIITEPDGQTIIDQINFSYQRTNISMGRDAQNNNTWSYFSSPTIGNQNGFGSQGFLTNPSISPEGGNFNQPISIAMENTDNSVSIHYSLNGTDPTEVDLQYNAEITISNTTVLNAKSFKENFIPSLSEGQFYLTNTSYSLPILAILTDPINLWDESSGIYENYLNQLTNKVRQNNSKIIYVGSLAGILPGGPGHSHQSVRDIASLSGIPNLKIIQPSCPKEVSMILNSCINDFKDSSYIRLSSIPVEIPFSLPEEYKIEKGKGTTIAEGRDVLVFSYGPVMLSELFKARTDLMKTGIKIKIINLPWLNYVDSGWLKEQIKGFSFLFTLDDHYESGGQGEMLLSNISQQDDKSDFPKIFSKIGIKEVPKCGSNEEVLKYHKLDSLNLAKRIRDQIL